MILACNTMHHVAEAVADAVRIPFLHIGDAAADAIRAAGHRRVGLLGTRFTMQAPFLRACLEARGLEVVLPDKAARKIVHDVIFDELCDGDFRQASRDAFTRVIATLATEHGADAVVLGCTEIGVLLGDTPLPIPAFDTSRTHVDAAHAWAFQ
jgi:aspartate racemase